MDWNFKLIFIELKLFRLEVKLLVIKSYCLMPKSGKHKVMVTTESKKSKH